MTTATPNFTNRTLYHGDNLGFLPGMNSGSVNLIATDPPFNKNKDFDATPDTSAAGARFKDRWDWEQDVLPSWATIIGTQSPAAWKVIEAARCASGDDTAAYLCWIGRRLLEMHRVLRDDGSIYIHTDHTSHAWMKALMDGIFGRRQFRNEIVWERTVARSSGNYFPRLHDIILFYAKSSDYTWNPVFTPLNEGGANKYRYDDGDGKGIYRLCSVAAPGDEGYRYDLGRGEKQPAKGYRMPESRAREWMASGKMKVTPGLVPSLKRYLTDSQGVMLGSIWNDIQVINPRAHERTGFPTQKPLALYERIVRASSNAGDFVLDPFAGSGTTLIAAERLDRQWVGMDKWEGTREMVSERMLGEGLSVDGETDRLLTFGDVHYTDIAPERTD